MDSREDFYEPAVCPDCGRWMTSTKSREEEGIEITVYCRSCGYEESNMVRR